MIGADMDKKEKWNLFLFCVTVAVCMVLMVWLVVEKPSDARVTIMEYAAQEGIGIQDYPDSLIRLLERNPETAEFVLHYPMREQKKIDLSGLDRSQGVPLLLQWDERWGYLEYGSDMVAITGCGPVCLSMVGWYLTGEEKFCPDRVVEFALENNYYTEGEGSAWALMSEGAKTLGLNVKELALVEDKIAAYLRAGDPIIAAMGPGDFTSSGHFIVLTGYEDGLLTVNDPNSRIKSEKQWAFDEIRDQISNLWVFLADGE